MKSSNPAEPVESGGRDLAALDLGSNSFHLIIVREEAGQIRTLDRLNEYVRLAEGLDEDNRLSEEKMVEALEALSRIAQRLRHIDHDNIRIVATNTLRKAKNALQFVSRVEAVLDEPVEIISGKEEARLIHLGVSRTRASGPGNNLIIDIGGGSTELIIGSNESPICMESLFMGCVSLSNRFFKDGEVSRTRMDDAILSASIELLPIVENYKKIGWDTAIGSSGSVKAVLKTVREAGWCKNLITAKGLDKLTNRLIQLGQCSPKSLPGLSDKRAPVFAGGVAVLNACFNLLGIDKMEVSDAALREGVIHDLIGRQQHQDVREESVNDLAMRYHVDQAHAERVEHTALAFYDQAAGDLDINESEFRSLLRWSAKLHEIGMDISHHQYHKHGAYIIANTDLTGFSLPERAIIATLVRGHRRKLNQLVFNTIPDNNLKHVENLVMLLRLATTLHRPRSPLGVPDTQLKASGKFLTLFFPPEWLESHPLTAEQFREENKLIANRGFKIEVMPMDEST
ncbi:MAG: exopolyphosphatase [marine bacterium B5-7]|nr:MAG: exopolyphosphatase [marine bacterium B5-7]